MEVFGPQCLLQIGEVFGPFLLIKLDVEGHFRELLGKLDPYV